MKFLMHVRNAKKTIVFITDKILEVEKKNLKNGY